MSTQQQNKTAFQELIVEEPDICCNCFRLIRKRRPIEQVNVKGQAQELRDSIQGIIKDDNDYAQHADFCDGDKPTDGQVPYCDCGIVLPGFKTQRPMSKRRFMEGAERLVVRFTELGASFDEEEFLDYCRDLKSQPENQFNEERMYRKAIEHAIDVETIQSNGDTDFRKSRCIQPGEYDYNEAIKNSDHDRPNDEEYRGSLVHDVPSVQPSTACNARLHNNVYQFVSYCNEETNGERCQRHNIEPQWPKQDLRDNNQFAVKHGLYSEPMNYFENIDDEEEKNDIKATKNSIIDKMSKNNDVGYVDEKIAKRIAVRLHIVEQASDKLQADGLTQTVISDDGGEYEKKNPVLDEIRRYDASIVDDLRKYGVLDDPESQKADALEQWREYID